MILGHRAGDESGLFVKLRADDDYAAAEYAVVIEPQQAVQSLLQPRLRAADIYEHIACAAPAEFHRSLHDARYQPQNAEAREAGRHAHKEFYRHALPSPDIL